MVIKKENYLVGKKFGRLLVLRRVFDWDKKNVRWKCKCDCGKYTIAITGNLKNGRHRSCGCGRGGPTNFRHKEKVYQNGYVFILDKKHHRANPHTGRVREHLIVMESMLGRKLVTGEEVHHKNGIRDDNRRSNLELWVKSQPAGTRPKDLVKWAKQILKRYDKKVTW